MVVLGISIGTRSSGIAILKEDRLVAWSTLSFKEAWSSEKRDRIVRTFHEQARGLGVTAVAVKVPPLSHFTEALLSLLDRLKEYVDTHVGCMASYKTRDIKAEFSRIHNKIDLVEHAVELYPELQAIRDRELLNKNRYHTKMFEAVIVASLHSTLAKKNKE